MIISRTRFFLIIVALIVIPAAGSQLLWLSRSKQVEGSVRFNGKEVSGQLATHYSVVRYIVGNDTFFVNGLDNMLFEKGSTKMVRYNADDPRDAFIGDFAGIWMGTIIYAGLPLLLVLIIAVHPGIVPYGSRMRLTLKPPFVRLESEVDPFADPTGY